MTSKGVGERGTILLHVLVTSVLVAIIASTLLRMTLLRAAATARSKKIVEEKRNDQQMLASILSAWNNANGGAGQTCASIAIPGYSYTGTPGSCNCSYTPSPQTNPPTLPTFQTTGQVTMPNGIVTCGLSISSADLP